MKDVKAFLNYIPSCPKSRGKYIAMYQAAGWVIEYFTISTFSWKKSIIVLQPHISNLRLIRFFSN